MPRKKMTQEEYEVRLKIKNARRRIERCLNALGDIDDAHAKRLIARYTAVFEGNFSAWMSAAAVFAFSQEGRFAASENLVVELSQDHPGMLHKFAKAANALPDGTDQEQIDRAICFMRQTLSSPFGDCRDKGLSALMTMALLEGTSDLFIPKLGQLAKQLGSTEMEYVQVHGVADVKHAKQFEWAVAAEMKLHQGAAATLWQATEHTVKFLKLIFV